MTKIRRQQSANALQSSFITPQSAPPPKFPLTCLQSVSMLLPCPSHAATTLLLVTINLPFLDILNKQNNTV